MLTPQKRCLVCQKVRKDKKLLQRIYDSTHFVPNGKESLRQVALSENLNYKALLVHVRKHQFIDSQDYQEKMLSNYDREATKKSVEKAVRAVDSIQAIIQKGAQRLEDGEITVSTDQLIRASQVKMQDEAKAKDQALALELSLAHFMSGESISERVYKEEIIDHDENTA